MFDDDEHDDDSFYQKMIDLSEIPTVSSSQSQFISTSTSTVTQETSSSSINEGRLEHNIWKIASNSWTNLLFF